MIGVISSTIFPILAVHNQAPERLIQTAATVASLQACGISRIFVADNSREWSSGVGEALKPAVIHRFEHFKDSQVKGPAEIHLLLGLIPYLPENEPILKISGRYVLKSDAILKSIKDADIVARFYDHSRWRRTISTRCYIAKDKDTLRLFLTRTLDEIYDYSNRIVGPRSLLKIAKQFVLEGGNSKRREGTSIEHAAARVLKSYKYRVKPVARLNLQGYIMGKYFIDE